VRAKSFVKTHQPGLFAHLDEPATPPACTLLRTLVDFDFDPLAIPSEQLLESDVGDGARGAMRAAGATRISGTSHFERFPHGNLLEYRSGVIPRSMRSSPAKKEQISSISTLIGS
jgi:hypothetical protein